MSEGLSKRAAALLERVREGRFYRLHDPRTPAAMAELVEAGLVVACMRVESVVKAFVPATGYTPYRPEQYVEPSPLGLKLPDDQADALRTLIENGSFVEVVDGKLERVFVAQTDWTTEAMVAAALLRDAGHNVVDE